MKFSYRKSLNLFTTISMLSLLSANAYSANRYTVNDADLSTQSFHDNDLGNPPLYNINTDDTLIFTGDHKITMTSQGVNKLNFDFAETDGIFGSSPTDNKIIYSTFSTSKIGGGNGNILINSKTSIQGVIGSAAAPINKIEFTDDVFFNYYGSAEVGTCELFANQISPSALLGSGNGSILINYSEAALGLDMDFRSSFGTSDLKLKYFAFSALNDSPGEQRAILRNGLNIFANEIDLYPEEITGQIWASSTLTFETNTTIDGVITTKTASGIGNVIFQGTSNVLRDIGQEGNGNLNLVHFSSNNPADTVTLGGNIYATNINHDRTNVDITKNITFQGNYSANNSTLTLKQNNLSFQGVGAVFNGTTILNITASDIKAGTITASANTDINNNIILNLTDISTSIPSTAVINDNGERVRRFPIFIENGANFNYPNDAAVTFNILSSTNSHVQWIYENGAIEQRYLQDNADKLVQDNSTGDSDNDENLNNIINSSDDNLVQQILEAQNKAEFLSRLHSTITEATERTHSGMQAATSFVGRRIDENFASYVKKCQVDKTTKPWAQGIYGSSKQGNRDKYPGYLAKSNYLLAGYDGFIKKGLVAGGMIGFGHINMKHTDSNQGDLTDISSFIGALYGGYEFAKDWQAKTIMYLGRNYLDNRELRGSSPYEIAKAKFHSNSYSARATLSRNLRIGDFLLITPSFSYEYSRIGAVSYKETGTVSQNLQVDKQPNQKGELIGGVSISRYSNHEYDFMPEIHANIIYDTIDEDLQITTKLDGIKSNMFTRTAENEPIFLNLGLGFTQRLTNMNFELSVDCYVNKTQINGYGMISLKVNI